MNAFGASVVWVLSAMNARRATQGGRRKCELKSPCDIDAPCTEMDGGWIERRGVSGRYKTCRACFRD